MTSLYGNQIPTVVSQSIKHLADFHNPSIPQQTLESKHRGKDTKCCAVKTCETHRKKVCRANSYSHPLTS